MTSKGVYEPLIKSYEQILNLRILKFKSYFPLGKQLVIDGKSKIIDGKGVSAPRNVEKLFIVMGALHTALHTLYIDHAHMYL